jgi:acetyl esterase/lipase
MICLAIGPVPLWDGDPPGGKTVAGPERDITDEKSDLIAGQRVARITGISVPTLTVYPAPPEKDTGTVVLVFPGGGYYVLAWDLEGTEVCEWLNTIGATAVLVKYRVPAPEGVPRHAPALEDAKKAIEMVRARASEWGISAKRVGVLGFSAGAHLSAALSTNYEKPEQRPDFAVLVYPGAIVPRNSKTIAPELKVTAETPPAFIVQSADDSVRVENSLAYYEALRAAKVPVEMHLYPSGGHGYGLRPSKHLVTTWPDRVADWLKK